VESWVGAGARILSACCGSGPPHVEGMVKRVKDLGKSKQT
jgi:S-methylmethionine-dependent homocysteine/selenocysteine methylase